MNAAPASRHWLASLVRTRTIAGSLVLASLVLGIATYIYAASHAGRAPETNRILVLILINLILLLALGVLVVRRAVKLWASWKRGSVGSKLQTRIVVTFTLVTIIPTVVVSVSSAMFFNMGIQSWFNERVSTALEESIAVARAYLSEHQEIIRADAVAMANDIDHEIDSTLLTPSLLGGILNTQVALRSLSEAVIFQHNHVVAQSRLSFSLAFERLPPDVIERMERREVVVTLEDQDKVRAFIKLRSRPETYLLIGRVIDSRVIQHVDVAEGSMQQYRHLKANISKLQIEFSVMFVLLALLLLFGATWYGMYFASRLVVPVTKLVNAADRVRGGDFTVRVHEGRDGDEVATLARAFNRMTSDLERQRTDLIEVNQQLDTRRRFSEAVLSGVSAGILALSRDKRVTLANPVAANLLLLPPETPLTGQSLTQLVPEFAGLFDGIEEKPGALLQHEVTIARLDASHVLHVRIVVERFLDSIEGYIVTCDDITELLIAQRSAAWSDVARRVAHEIKNPLTPIQLAAERLRKKYLPQITQEPENYLKYLDTITRHVGDIGKIVEEFVLFARMPAPVIKREDLSMILKKAVFSEQTAHPDIQYHLPAALASTLIVCDEQQISRVLLNLLKNAAEALEDAATKDKTIRITLEQEEGEARLRLSDSGPGFPPDKLHRLLEPYMTTRAKGTGLGLAIVKKIMDDHHATLHLENLPQGGAAVTLVFPIDSGKNVT